MSLANVVSISGRRIFTATQAPSCRSRALCNWEIEAAAKGSSSNSLKHRSRGPPRSCSTMRRASLGEKPSAWSCSLTSSSQISFGKRSRRMETSCPTLIQSTPMRWHNSRINSPIRRMSSRPVNRSQLMCSSRRSSWASTKAPRKRQHHRRCLNADRLPRGVRDQRCGRQ